MEEYWVPACVKEYLGARGFAWCGEDMESYIRAWEGWMRARGEFYDYSDVDAAGRRYRVHRRSIKPAMRVCQEWGSLLLNEKTSVTCERAKANEWLGRYLEETGVMAAAQTTLVKAFGLGTAALALSIDLDARKVKVRHYDARMVVPLTWDSEGVSECAFVTRVFFRGKGIDQLQMHLKGEDGYRIETVMFDSEGERVECEGVVEEYETGSPFPTFCILKPAIPNTCVGMSPYGQSIFHDAIDAVQACDLAFDALINEVDAGKMRIFLSDVMFDVDKEGGSVIPFGKNDCTVFRKVMSTEDTIQEFAPSLRTEQQEGALRIALQMLGDLTGLGISYFDFDASGYVKTATEVASDNSVLMRNIRRHENALTRSLTGLLHALLACARGLGETIPQEGAITIGYDDSIITDTAAEKAQDLAELGRTMQVWEYRAKWYGEDETTAKARAGELGAAKMSA